MTHARKLRPFLPALSVAAALAAGAVQAQETDDLRRVPLCTLPLEMPLPASVLDRIRAQEDYEFLLRYSSENCPETALILAGGATASIGGVPAASAGGADERRVPVCRLEEEWPLSARALARIRNGADFEELLLYTSDNCPEVALLLADTATATIPDDGGDGPDDGVDREGPEDRRDPQDPTTPPEEPQDPTTPPEQPQDPTGPTTPETPVELPDPTVPPPPPPA